MRINNKYIEIRNIKDIIYSNLILDDNEEKNIEDIDVEEDINMDINTIIYSNKRVESYTFTNIYCKIRNMITDYDTIKEDRYRDIPEYIENIVIDKIIYKRNEEIEMIRFMSRETLKRFIEKNKENDKRILYNKNNETILMMCCKNNLEEMAIEIIDNEDNKLIFKRDKYKRNAYEMACDNKLKDVLDKMIEKMDDEEINECKDEKIFRMMITGYEELIIKMIRRIKMDIIDKYFEISLIAWISCNRYEKLIIEIMKKMSNKRREELMREEYIGEGIKNIAIKYKLNNLEEYINNINNELRDRL